MTDVVGIAGLPEVGVFREVSRNFCQIWQKEKGIGSRDKRSFLSQLAGQRRERHCGGVRRIVNLRAFTLVSFQPSIASVPFSVHRPSCSRGLFEPPGGSVANGEVGTALQKEPTEPSQESLKTGNGSARTERPRFLATKLKLFDRALSIRVMNLRVTSAGWALKTTGLKLP